jgi:hypothetical protein
MKFLHNWKNFLVVIDLIYPETNATTSYMMIIINIPTIHNPYFSIELNGLVLMGSPVGYRRQICDEKVDDATSSIQKLDLGLLGVFFVTA